MGAIQETGRDVNAEKSQATPFIVRFVPLSDRIGRFISLDAFSEIVRLSQEDPDGERSFALTQSSRYEGEPPGSGLADPSGQVFNLLGTCNTPGQVFEFFYERSQKTIAEIEAGCPTILQQLHLEQDTSHISPQNIAQNVFSALNGKHFDPLSILILDEVQRRDIRELREIRESRPLAQYFRNMHASVLHPFSNGRFVETIPKYAPGSTVIMGIDQKIALPDLSQIDPLLIAEAKLIIPSQFQRGKKLSELNPLNPADFACMTGMISNTVLKTIAQKFRDLPNTDELMEKFLASLH